VDSVDFVSGNGFNLCLFAVKPIENAEKCPAIFRQANPRGPTSGATGRRLAKFFLNHFFKFFPRDIVIRQMLDDLLGPP